MKLTPEQSERLINEMENIDKALSERKDPIFTTGNLDALSRLSQYIRPAMPHLAHALGRGMEAIRIVKDVQRADVTSKLKPRKWTAEEVHEFLPVVLKDSTKIADLREGREGCSKSPSGTCWHNRKWPMASQCPFCWDV